MKTIYLVTLLILFLVGCKCVDKAVSSGGIDTASWYADIQVQAIENQTTVDIHLKHEKESGSVINLESIDELHVTAGGTTKILREFLNGSNCCWYRAIFDVGAPGTEFNIALQRQQKTPAPNSFVTLPDGLTMTSPTPNQIFSRDGDLTVAWEPSMPAKNLSVNFAFACGDHHFQGLIETVNDTGSRPYQVADLTSNWNSVGEVSCNVTITLTRENTGSLDNNYRNGRIVARRTATVSVVIQPPGTGTP